MTQVAKIEDETRAEVAAPNTGMLIVMERAMMNPEFPVERLEALLRIHNEQEERAESRAAEKAFNRAYAAAKMKIPVVYKDGNVHFEKDGKTVDYDHETLAGIAEVVDPILAEHGLAYRFRPGKTEEGRITVTCILSHVDGYKEEYTLDGQADTSGSKNNFQAVGSTTTYLSRYTLRMALGLSTAKDDDASKSVSKTAIDEEQFRRLRELMEEADADEDKLKEFLGHKGELFELPAGKYGAAEKMLRQKINKRKAEAE